MTRAAMYIYKTRDCLGMGRPSAHRPQGSIMYGKWRRVCDYATESEALDQLERDELLAPELKAVFHRGKKVPHQGHESVVEFYPDGRYRTVLRQVTTSRAMERAKRIIESDDAKAGRIIRVMITDIFDCSVFEWEYGKGVLHPPELKGLL